MVARVAAYPCDYPSRKDGVQKSMESISGRCRTPSNWSRNTACLRVITSGFCAQTRGIPPGELPGAAAPAPAPAPRSAARRRQRTFVDGFLPEKTPKTRDFTLAKPGKNVQEVVEIAWVSLKRVLNEARLRNKLEKLDNEVGTPVATMAPRHVERLNALAGTVGRNVVVPFMLLLRLASFFR